MSFASVSSNQTNPKEKPNLFPEESEMVEFIYTYGTKENMKKWFGMSSSKFLMLHIAGETEMKRYIKEKVRMSSDEKLLSLFSF